MDFLACNNIYLCTADNSETTLKMVKAKNQQALQVEFKLQ